MTENIKSAAVSDRGLSEKRPQNEDSYLEMPSRGIFAVADGVGGAQAGDVASQMAMEILQEAFVNSRNGGDSEELMQVAIKRANEAIFQMSHDLPQLSTMATTVVALHVDGNIATIGHVGDSRLYRVDSRGNLFRETQDHSVVEEEVRAGRMTAAQAAHHPSRNVISRALGAENTVEVDMKTIMFEPNTTFLLCSDGITRHIEDNELRQLLSSQNAPAQICDDMKNICYGRGAEDNLTAVIIRVEGSGAESSDDVEESTIATARQQSAPNTYYDNSASADDSDEFQTQELRLPDEIDNFKTQESINSSQFLTPEAETAKSEPSYNEAPVAVSPAPSSYQAASQDEYVEEKSGSFLGKLVSTIFLLLVGAGLGVAGYHFYKQTQAPVQAPVVQKSPEPTPMQTSNITQSSFDKNRRNVDINPEQYIKTNGTAAKDAIDYYLLGRAYLLTEQYKEAWGNFSKAKEMLSQVDADDRAMLGNEIALGLSIVNVDAGKRFFKAERDNMNSPTKQGTNSNSNVNANMESGQTPATEAPQ